MNLSKFDLKQNPFRLTPPINPDEIIWAGFKDLKAKLESRILLNLQTTPSKIVLNWGYYGSGKTHAANYFTRTKRLLELTLDKSLKEAKSIKINLPRTSRDIVQAFLRSFLGQINIEEMYDELHKVKSELSDIEGIISSVSQDNVIKDLFILMCDDDEKNKLGTVEKYLYGDSTKTELREIGLPIGLTDDEQIVNLLSTFINVITFDKQIYSGFILWIDEFEDIDSLSKSLSDRFVAFLRQLIDKTPNNLTIFMNFTPKPFLNKEDLSVVLGEALTTRIKSQISFDEPSENESLEYIYDLLNNNIYRVGDVKNYKPFEEDMIIKLVKHIGRRSVRKINEALSIILELAVINDVDNIDNTFLNQIKNEIPSWED